MRPLMYISLILLIAACGKKDDSQKPLDIGQADIVNVSLTTADHEYVAGDSIIVNGVSAKPLEGQVECLITYSYGEYIDNIQVDGLQFDYKIPRVVTQKSGVVFVSFIYESSLIGTREFKILPGLPYDKIDSYSGPATIESSGIDWNLVTAIAKDQYDNPCADGTEMNYRLKYPDGSIRNTKEEMSMLLSGVRIDPTRKAGKIFTGVQSDQAHSVEREVLVTPTWPERFTIEVLDHLPYAEQRQLLKLRTSIIKDRFDNTVSDGTAVWFMTEDSQGKINRYKSFVVNGRCNVQIENPEYATRWKISAQVENSVSAFPIYLSFTNTTKDIPLSYNQVDQTIIVGPITGPLGQFIPNGVLVTLSLRDEDNQIITQVDKEVLFGYYKWALPVALMNPGRYQLTAFIGASKEEVELNYEPSITNDHNSDN